MSDVILEVRNLTKTFGGGGLVRKSHPVRAVDDVSFELPRSSSFGLVGESGSGKSTTAHMICRMLSPDSGQVLLEGKDVLGLKGRDLKQFRREVQMVFQDPFASLDPRWTVGRLVAEGMHVHGHVPKERRRERVEELLELVGLYPEHAKVYPHKFSGGQRQRIGIARALAVEPSVLVLDEPVSALDVSIRAQILTLLKDLQQKLGLSYLFIAHDLAIVEQFCDRLAVMRQGRIVEEGTCAQLYGAPREAYTRELLAAVPIPDPRQRDKPVGTTGGTS
jgi:ABC-type oligopeptide transport system ATPase subunit